VSPEGGATLIDALLAEQRTLTAVERFARAHERHPLPALEKHYRRLLPATAPNPGQQYAFEVDLDKCSGCKSCVSACHSLNGLDEHETWRSVGLLVSDYRNKQLVPHSAFQQHVTTACHHCADPGCLNGCPVLAYDKDPLTGIVRHLDDQCMGCSYCIMKCPYEVPKYSSRLGIVRKCDLCANRLAVGEAPACVQACPDEAIKITLVERDSAIRHRPSAIKTFLPDSPDPALTLPTTRYLSARGLPKNLIAADHDAPRLDNPHWPLVWMLVLTQASAGLFVASAILPSRLNTTALKVSCLALLVIGLVAATMHLGQPMKAWRGFLGWRKSWLSRELIAFNAFAGAAALAIIHPPFSSVAALAGLVAVFTSAMVYVDTGRPFWCARRTFGNFFGTTLLLGTTLAALLLGWSGTPTHLAQLAAIVALIIRTTLFIWRRIELLVARRNAASPIHFNARIIRELLPHTTNLRTALFVASSVFGFLAIENVAQLAPVWASVAALTTLSSEVIGRYVFFAAGASKRMPGGIAA
jgi:Fe-S-cluster-containing dehydrogenase component/DMSO reductase anchor subunit